jgi:two-component system NtrC family sensor kinase
VSEPSPSQPIPNPNPLHPSASEAAADPESVEPVRLRRIQQFLLTHLVLCGIALVALVGEAMLVTDRSHVVTSLATGIVPMVLTIASYFCLARRVLVSYLIPGILSIDSVLVVTQMVVESGLESGWAATPVLLIIMLPLFSHRRGQVWWLSGLQLLLYGTVFTLRAQGVIEYDVRAGIGTEGAFQLYTGLGYAFLILGAAFLAGRTSVDVVNSQRQLEAEVTRATAALREAQARLVQQEKMVGLGQLTAGVAHEINNPLTFVTTNITSLERDLDDVMTLLERYQLFDDRLAEIAPDAFEEISTLRADLFLDSPREILGELLADTRDGLERVQHIIRDLKTFARLDEAERKSVDVHEGIETTLKMLRHKMDGSALIERDYAPLPEIEAFPALLNQVFMNILQNAADVMPANGGRISIRTTLQGDAIHIEFADNGPGVPAEIRGRIFDPFFTTKEVGTGTGLGLSLSDRIIDRHGGRIEVGDSALGGALFRVILPLGRLEAGDRGEPLRD